MKKILVVLLVVVLALIGLVACQKAAPTPTTAPAKSAAPVATAAANKVDLGSAEIRMGHYGPLSGSTSVSGIPSEQGGRLAVKMINDGGGIYGSQIKWIAYDDKAEPEAAVKAVTKLISSDKVHVIAGGQISGNIQASGQIVEDAKIPEVATGTSPKWLSLGWKYLFRSIPNADGGIVPFINAMKDMKRNKFATLVLTDEFAKTVSSNVFNAMTKDGGFTFTVQENFATTDTDWSGQLIKMYNSGANAFAIWGHNVFGPMIKQVRQVGFKGYVFCSEGAATKDTRDVGGDAANGIVFYSTHCVPDKIEDAQSDPEKKMLENYVKVYGALPASEVSYRTYDAVNIIAKGITDAKSLDGTKVRDAIKNIKGYVGIAGTFDYTAFDNGEGMSGQNVWVIHKNIVYRYDNFKKTVGDVSTAYPEK